MSLATIGLDELLYTREGFRQGRPCLAGTQITVHTIIAQHLMGMTTDDILADFPHASLAGIYAALAYFFKHREQVMSEFEEDERWGEEQARALGAEII